MEQPYLPEHAGVGSPGRTDDNQSQEERDAVKLAEKIYAKNKKARAAYDKDWVTYFKYFRNDQWKNKRPLYRHSEVINVITSNIRNIIPILTDPQPQVNVTPEDPTDYEFAQILNQLISSKWDRDNYNMIVAESLIDACVIGTAIGYVPWVEELCDGIGDYTFETCDPAHVFPAPNMRDMNDRRGKTLVIAEPVDVSEIWEDYPEKKAKIKPDLSDAVSYNSYMDEAQEFSFRSPVDNRLVADTRNSNQNNPDLVLKITCYILSDEVVQTKETMVDSQTGETIEQEKTVKKYPRGRKIVTASGQLLEDVELPYEDGKFPYARLVNDIVPRCFWGEGEVGPQKSPQDIVNKLISYFLDYMIIVGNPHWVIDSEAQVDVDNITNEPGMIVVKKKGGEAQQVPGIAPPPYLINTMQYFLGEVFSKVNGQNEVSQGALTKAQLSGEAIAQLTEASQTRLRAKARNLDCYMSQVGQLKTSRIMQFYNLPRVVRVVGDGTNASKYFKIAIEKQPVDPMNPDAGMHSVATYQEYVPGQNGPGAFGAPKQIPLKGALDIRITSGSALPLQKAQRDAQAERFFDKGILDAEDLLDIIEYPNKEKIVSKLQQRQMQQAAQAAIPGAGNGPPPGPPQ